MKEHPLRTTVIGSYPFPGWLEFASQNLDKFGEADREELIDDAVTIAIHDQVEAGLDVITDGEQTRLDFNLSFYGFLEGVELESAPPRRFGPPAHDQRGRHRVVGELRAPRGPREVRRYFQSYGGPDLSPLPALDASLFRKFQRPRGRSAPLRANVSGVPRFARGRNSRGDGEPRIRRAGNHR